MAVVLRGLVLVAICMLATVGAPAGARHQAAHKTQSDAGSGSAGDELGPEMTAYMGYIDAEVAELKHLFDVGEVSAEDYKIQNARLYVMRTATLRVGRSRGEDVVPELDILLESELTTILPTGIGALRGKRSGDLIGTDWRYHGTIRRGLTFYILERTNKIGRDTSY